jgi:hypothetical protein
MYALVPTGLSHKIWLRDMSIWEAIKNVSSQKNYKFRIIIQSRQIMSPLDEFENYTGILM